MIKLLDPSSLNSGGLFVLCTSHEPRCLGSINMLDSWRPDRVALLSYTEHNPKREANRAELKAILDAREIPYDDISIDDSRLLMPHNAHNQALRTLISRFSSSQLIIDISVFTRKHLYVFLRWLNSSGSFRRALFLYTEPQQYVVAPWLPMSFGVKAIESIAGFPSISNPSRPLHLILELGFEGDRALAVYEELQPSLVTLFIAQHPNKKNYDQIAREMNRDLIQSVGEHRLFSLSALDPELVLTQLRKHIGSDLEYGSRYSCAICSMGTKPQAIGTFMLSIQANNPPAILYASPLRHNQRFYSEGIDKTWCFSAQWR